MNIGLIGSGGREHALCQKLYESKLSKKIICFPGNAGTSKYARNVNVNIKHVFVGLFVNNKLNSSECRALNIIIIMGKSYIWSFRT